MFINCECSPEVQKAMDIYLEFIQLAEEAGLKDFVLAGGAPRDIFLGRVPSDFDVFSEMSFYDLLSIVTILGLYIISSTDADNISRNYKIQYLNGVVSFSYKNIIVQFISLSCSTSNIFSTFNCSLSMIIYDQGIIKPRKEFITSWLKKHITFYNDNSQPYINKIRNKFPDYGVTLIRVASPQDVSISYTITE